MLFNLTPKIAGIIIGLACLVIYIAISSYRRSPPVLSDGLNILLASAGIILYGDLLRIVLVTPISQLGDLKDYQDALAIGAVALLWISAGEIIKKFHVLFRPHVSDNNTSKPKSTEQIRNSDQTQEEK